MKIGRTEFLFVAAISLLAIAVGRHAAHAELLPVPSAPNVSVVFCTGQRLLFADSAMREGLDTSDPASRACPPGPGWAKTRSTNEGDGDEAIVRHLPQPVSPAEEQDGRARTGTHPALWLGSNVRITR